MEFTAMVFPDCSELTPDYRAPLISSIPAMVTEDQSVEVTSQNLSGLQNGRPKWFQPLGAFARSGEWIIGNRGSSIVMMILQQTKGIHAPRSRPSSTCPIRSPGQSPCGAYVLARENHARSVLQGSRSSCKCTQNFETGSNKTTQGAGLQSRRARTSARNPQAPEPTLSRCDLR